MLIKGAWWGGRGTEVARLLPQPGGVYHSMRLEVPWPLSPEKAPHRPAPRRCCSSLAAQERSGEGEGGTEEGRGGDLFAGSGPEIHILPPRKERRNAVPPLWPQATKCPSHYLNAIRKEWESSVFCLASLVPHSRYSRLTCGSRYVFVEKVLIQR